MISVTVAANGRSRRYVGAHLKAYGSGRLSIAELDYDPANIKRPQRSSWSRFLWKFIHVMVQILKSCFPFFTSSKDRKLYRKLTTRSPAPIELPSPIQFYDAHLKNLDNFNRGKGWSLRLTEILDEFTNTQNLDKDILLNIFKYLDGTSVKNCAGVNKTWRKIILKNREKLPKIELDMIHIVFDEGNVVLHTNDTKKSPERYTLPPLRLLEVYLRHVNCDSLMIRGLIPVEAVLVMTSLLKMKFTPNQMYFIWCIFHEDSIPMLHRLMKSSGKLCDIGMEGCGPAPLLNDDLFQDIIPDLRSMRLFSGVGGAYHGIGDRTINSFAKNIVEGKVVDTIHISACHISFKALLNFIRTWMRFATEDISVTIGNSTHFIEETMVEDLAHEGIIVEEDGYITSGPYRMSLFC